MNDAATVPELHGVADAKHQFEPMLSIEFVRVGVVGEGLATGNQFHDEVWDIRPIVGCSTRLQNSRDARVLQPAEHFALQFEPPQD